MTDQECDETFVALRKILEEQGLGWLAEAVSQEIQEGVIEEASEKNFRTEGSELTSFRLAPAHPRAIKEADFLVRREFSSGARLQLLVDAIEEVASQANDIEQDMLKFFGDNDRVKSVRFIDVGAPQALIEVSPEGSDARSSAVGKLQDLLNELRKEIPQ
jgi:hypothetical protein